MVFYAPPEKQPLIQEALGAYLQVPFKFESQGSTLIYSKSGDFFLPPL
jgi:hypothetical protein